MFFVLLKSGAKSEGLYVSPLPLRRLCEQFACSAVVSHDSSLHRFSNKYAFSMKVQDIQFALYSVGQHCNKVIKK